MNVRSPVSTGDALSRFIVALGDELVMPGSHNHKVPIDHNQEHNIMERGIGGLKQYRRVAMRYGKTASSHSGSVLFAAIRHWWRNPFAANVYRV